MEVRLRKERYYSRKLETQAIGWLSYKYVQMREAVKKK